MEDSNAKSLLLLYVLNVLKEYSDENHQLTQNEIKEKMYSIYGVDCNRKTIAEKIDTLIFAGYDIIKNSNKGCFLGSREFEPSEIQFLVDSIFSSKSIDGKHSKKLANKISSFLSVYQRKQYKYIYKSNEITRTDNKTIFYNIDIINEAIESGKQIQFCYEKFCYKKEDKKKRLYVVNPYFLINNQGKYYLVCNNDYFDSIANYKLENISNISILDSKIKPITQIKGFEKGFDISKYANENIYMFSTNSIDATIKIGENWATTYVDEWFGKNASFYEKNGQIYASVKANETSLIYWCLQYGELVEFVEPKDTRNKIKEMIKKINNKYNVEKF